MVTETLHVSVMTWLVLLSRCIRDLFSHSKRTLASPHRTDVYELNSPAWESFLP